MTWQAASPTPLALGESIFWNAADQRLYGVDIDGRRAWRFMPALDGVSSPGEMDFWPLPSDPGCLAPAMSLGQPSGWVLGLRDGVYRARSWGGPLERIAHAPWDTATQRSNDGKCDAQGRFWVGTLHQPVSGPRQPVAALYCVDGRSGQAPWVMQRRLGDVANVNGLGWSPDGGTMYWADTPSHWVQAWDVDAQTDSLSGPRTFHQFAGKPTAMATGDAAALPYGGRPDGAAVDVLGNYYCAMYEGGCIVKLSPAGIELERWPLPVRCPTMPCFGGPDMRTLFVSSARQGRPAVELEEYPLSGCVLARQVDTPGLPVSPWRDAG